MLILLIGDYFIPSRESDLPEKFKKLLVPGKISAILSTGNVQKETLDYLETISHQVFNIRGSDDSLKCKESQIVEFKGIKFGVVNPLLYEPLTLEQLARKMDVNVLVTGGTHQFEAYERNSRFYINPGSCTGAFTVDVDTVIPTFVLMDLGSMGFSLYIYKLLNNQVKVEKMDFQFK